MTIAISNEIRRYPSKWDELRTVYSRLLKNLKTATRRRKIYNTTYFELSSQSDKTLADLGIYRCNIKRLALEASLKGETNEA